ncbi:MAG: type II toxin-antitoxin system prevent-host-death family antitoxin [Candidatus Rokubacteria bacterium]|nr:type II toxin-antitoxin system prevent-host-death family antitoxin [Candidatus Rokubacteria bacterium]
MPVIKRISDLRNRANEISRLCHREDRPVFITRNGQSDLVVMSHAHYDRLQAQLELYRKLDEAEVQAVKGAKGIGHREMIRRLRARIP